VHALGAIERARRDEDHPAQPLREDAVTGHRHTRAALHRDELAGGAVLAELVLVGAAFEQRVGQRRQHGNVGTGSDGHVPVGERRGLAAAGIEHPHPSAARPVAR
jgi:hypothetical protein